MAEDTDSFSSGASDVEEEEREEEEKLEKKRGEKKQGNIEKDEKEEKEQKKERKNKEAPLKGAGFTLILVDLQLELVNQLRKHFKGLPDVKFQHCRFEQLPKFDCMVSAANSFGLMDGGVDAAITAFFGDQLQQRVQQHIIDHFDGEQPVGTSFILPTNHPRHPWLAHTPYLPPSSLVSLVVLFLSFFHPVRHIKIQTQNTLTISTMRVPMSIQGTDHVYLAMKAMLRAIKDHNQAHPDNAIRSVACTGLGTFYGVCYLSDFLYAFLFLFLLLLFAACRSYLSFCPFFFSPFQR
ncbi:Phage-tail assembly protein-like protein, variant 2 [Balamuthia mandrillaris]